MRIHRLLLSDVKGVESREVIFPDSGVVVVEGDNEIGKTTMIEALDLLFQEKDSSKKRHVLAMRPVGRDVPSIIEAEVSTGDYRFVYRKQWFRKPGTVLTVLEPRREDLTGSAAHDRVAAILDETTDADLWRALRLMQATPLDATDLSGSTALADALEAAAGQAVGSAGAQGESLLAAAEAAYREFYTATGRPTGPLRDADLLLDEARAARDAADLAVREVADDVTRHAQAVRDLARWEGQLATASEQLEDTEREWEVAQEVVREADRARVDVDLARGRAEAAQTRRARRAELVGALAEAETAVARREAEIRELHEAEVPLRDALDRARVADDAAREVRRAARRAASRAESDVALVADLQDLAALLDRAARLSGAQERLREAEDRAAATRFTADVDAIDAAVREADVARATWRAGSGRWSLSPTQDALTVVVDGEERDLSDALEGVLAEPVEIEIPSVATLRIRPPAGAAQQAEAVSRAEARVAEVLAAAGVPDLDAARAAARAHRDAQQALAEALRAVSAVSAGESADVLAAKTAHLTDHVHELVQRRVAEALPDESDLVAALGGGASHEDGGPVTAVSGRATVGEVTAGVPADERSEAPADVRHDAAVEVGHDAAVDVRVPVPAEVAAVARAGVAELGSMDPEWVDAVIAWIVGGEASEPAPSRRLRTLAAQARAEEDKADALIAATEAEVAERRRALDAHRTAVARAEVSAEAATEALTRARTALAEAREENSDEDLQAALDAALGAVHVAQERQAAVGTRVESLDPTSVKARLDGARAAVESARARFVAARDERLTIEVRLKHAGEQGRAEALIEAESALARAERDATSVHRRADAARTLYEALTRHRAAVTSTYVEPFGKAVSRLGRVVFGPSFEVEVGENLTIEARVLEDRRIPYESLSTGAKEQMAILTRLAAASLVDPRHGAPVILDDALGYSDPVRLQRLCSAFSLVGDGAQIILLTCTPGRYAAVPGTHLIQLTSRGSR